MMLFADRLPRKVYLTKEHVFLIPGLDPDPDSIVDQLLKLQQPPLPVPDPGPGSGVL